MDIFMPIDLKYIDELARRLSSLVPGGADGRAAEELGKSFKALLQASFKKLDLVTREEFDVQRAVLLRTRAQLEDVQNAVAQLEKKTQPGSVSSQSNTH